LLVVPAASWLCNLIAGISVVLYERGTGLRKTKRRAEDRPGNRFTKVMQSYYPWQAQENPQELSHVLYQLVRNPMSHCLASPRPGKRDVVCMKSSVGMSPAEIDALDAAYESGVPQPRTLMQTPNSWNLNVPHLYAGVVEMLHRLVMDDLQMVDTEQRLSQNLYVD
jgi:hypothetical protein